jgi:hypothetical protein
LGLSLEGNNEMLAGADLKDATQSPEPLPAKGVKAGRAILTSEFPELRLFGLLMWRFGHPNGPMTFFLANQQGDPDAPFKWDYLFVPTGNLRMHVVRGSVGIEVFHWGEQVSTEDIVAYLKGNIARYSKEIDDTISGLEEHTLILNPYIRHRNIANLALEELDKLVLSAPPQLRPHLAKRELDEWAEQQREFWEAVQRQASLTILLVTESAFMGESYLNLLLAILMRREIRESKAIMSETLMRRWRAKIERLHVDCTGIPKPANLGDTRIANAKKMFDIRNRVAHSYPDPKDMAVGKMWFYRSFPVLETGLPFLTFAVTLQNQLPSADEARFCKKAADQLVDFLTELVEYDSDQTRFITASNPLGYNESKKIYSVPFGRQLAMSITAPPESEPEEHDK